MTYKTLPSPKEGQHLACLEALRYLSSFDNIKTGQRYLYSLLAEITGVWRWQKEILKWPFDLHSEPGGDKPLTKQKRNAFLLSSLHNPQM